MPGEGGTLELQSGDARAVVALRGAEPVSWTVGGRELLWHGDPAHWNRSAPILFPVVGASRGGVVRVGGASYPMPQHGFARDGLFEVVEHASDAVRLRLADGPETRRHDPYAFALEVQVALSAEALRLAFSLRNTGEEVLPYALGFHPGFAWPFDAARRDGHAVVFAAPERPEVPLLTPDGLLRRQTRRIAFDGTRLPLTPELFEEGALVFLGAASRALRFTSPSGAAITLAAEDFPHLAVWTKPAAPFVSLECWTGHADWEDAQADLAERASMRLLAPGCAARHAATMAYAAAG